MTIYGVFGYGDKQVYVGTTYNPLRVRMSQHKYAAKKYNWLHKGEANRFYWYFTSGVWECRTLEIAPYRQSKERENYWMDCLRAQGYDVLNVRKSNR